MCSVFVLIRKIKIIEVHVHVHTVFLKNTLCFILYLKQQERIWLTIETDKIKGSHMQLWPQQGDLMIPYRCTMLDQCDSQLILFMTNFTFNQQDSNRSNYRSCCPNLFIKKKMKCEILGCDL